MPLLRHRIPTKVAALVGAIVGLAALALGTAACTASPRDPAPASPPSVSPPPVSQPLALFIGDSYTLGEALPSEQLAERWSSIVSRSEDWDEVNVGCSGSGYVRPGLLCQTSYLTRLETLGSLTPQIVLVSGGRNDLGSTDAEIAEAVTATFAAIRKQYPEAKIYGISAIVDVDTPSPRIDALNAAVLAAVVDVGGTYLDLGDPLLGRPDLMAADGVHPNAAGHAVIAQATLAALRD